MSVTVKMHEKLIKRMNLRKDTHKILKLMNSTIITLQAMCFFQTNMSILGISSNAIMGAVIIGALMIIGAK